MKTLKTVVILLFMGLMLVANGLADEIKLKNGDRLTGKIVKSDGKALTIKTDYAGDVTVSAEAITEISSDQQLYFALSDGKTLTGKVETKAGRYEVAVRDGGTIEVEPAKLQAIRSQSEQEAHERLLKPRWVDLWNGGLDFGYNLTTGNTRTNTIALGSNLSRQTRRDKTSLYAAYINAKNKTKGVTETTANAIRGGGRYEIGISGRLSAFGFADFEYNEIQLLDLRSVLGGGLGYTVVKNDRTQFQVFGGGAYNKENFSTGLKRNTAEILVGEDLSLRLSDRVLFKERMQFFPNLSEKGEYRITFDSSLNTRLTRWLTWQVTASNRYLSNPVAGSKNNDLLFTTGVGITFTNFSFRK
ncbi:MAG: DUF481 domain-containing protein [Acidobacteria bacterium]|nr:DUF481 domain-containing protein [Acidobacteriota bacterium]